jgi:hypothetical protein
MMQTPEQLAGGTLLGIGSNGEVCILCAQSPSEPRNLRLLPLSVWLRPSSTDSGCSFLCNFGASITPNCELTIPGLR